ncbi:unnamed protein product [Rhizoctonia solani]|uniref:Glycoside hydrolase family 5 domain-containing protein n=1 Tax=Rhizoctonia solani TaxID=456999 RepID=A0A8H2WA60_9AGAM|nr:unnamed protein product [Rhizoctonia solani]
MLTPSQSELQNYSCYSWNVTGSHQTTRRKLIDLQQGYHFDPSLKLYRALGPPKSLTPMSQCYLYGTSINLNAESDHVQQDEISVNLSTKDAPSPLHFSLDERSPDPRLDGAENSAFEGVLVSMKLHSIALGSGLLGAAAIRAAKNGLPVDKVYGVNLGGWLLSEPWMNPKEWLSMGGEQCDDCSTCAASEFSLVQKLGQTKADEVFAQHWSTWFTQKNVDEIAAAGLNSVRIPLGYWIVEPLVDRSTEFYPRGGMKWLKKGLRMLKAKGIHVVLDHHALPGVSSANQMFAGHCTSDVQFYTEKNYRRALVWAAVMTFLSHSDPDFSTVFSIEAINEPTMDANKTPGYGDYQKRFVKVVRLVELLLGIKCDDTDYSKLFDGDAYTNFVDLGLTEIGKHLADEVLKDVLTTCVDYMSDISISLGLNLNLKLLRRALSVSANVNVDVNASNGGIGINLELGQVAKGHGAGRGPMGPNGPILARRSAPALEPVVPHGLGLDRHNAKRRLHHDRGISITLGQGVGRKCLMTSFPNMHWQYNNPPNPADAAIGPQLYDAHLYFSFGGVADPNAESYMQVICNTDRVKNALAVGNSPLVFGEWSLATNFPASDQFMHDWADAQRHIYAGQADGWFFWSFKIEEGSPNVPAWTYFGAREKGYFSNDPSKLTNPNICDKWMANTTTTA